MRVTPFVVVAIVALLAGGLGLLLLILTPNTSTPVPVAVPETATTTLTETPFSTTQLIGVSVEGREISATTFGHGDTHLLFVGGMHGGYEWNSVLLAYEMMEQLFGDPGIIPDNLTIHVIPNLNPDGTYEAVPINGPFSYNEISAPDTRIATARFNSNNVDLNRNFDCKWAPTSTWQGKEVSAGTAPFSEPEAKALRDYVLSINPSAVVFWHSRANNVYASECHEGPLPETLEIMQLYADAANYGAVPVFDAYPITGDAEGWLASIGIPAITVELETYDSPEFNRNATGVMALLEHFSTAK